MRHQDCPTPLWHRGLRRSFGGAGEVAALWRDVVQGLGGRSMAGPLGLGGGAWSRLGSCLGPVGQHGCARLWAGGGAGTQQPPLTEAFGIFCRHRCRSIGSEAREGVPRFLINLFSDIFSSLDWIFFSMPTLPSKEESVGIAPRSLKRSHRGSRVCWGRSGAVYLSQQTKFRPGSARLQRDLSQWRVLPSWRGYLIFVLHSFAWLMPPWDSLYAAGSVCSESCQGVCGTDPARCCWRGLPQPQQCLS